MANQPPWEDLPPLCWEAVFRSLVSAADLESVSVVCKRFLHISNALRTSLSIPYQLTPRLDSFLSRSFASLKSIDLSSFRGDLCTVLRWIAQFPLPLERLDLSNQESLRFDGLREMGPKFGALKVLLLSKIGFLGDDDLVWIGQCFPLLEELDIRYPRLNPSAVVTDHGISALSQKLRRLSRCDVSGNRYVTDKSLEVLSMNCPSLRVVGFRKCGLITGRGVASLITNRPHLVSLALNNMVEETIFCEELVDSFRHARGLSSLDFSGSFIWDGLLMSVAEANIPLKSLNLSYAGGFSFDGIQNIVRRHRGIKVLNFESVHFLADDMVSVMCRYLRSLTRVNVSKCFRLTKTTFYNLIRRCPRLEHISMERTNLRKFYAEGTNIAVKSQVRSLNISGNVYLTDECIKKIGRMCPNLRYLDVTDCLEITGDGFSGVLKSCREVKHLKIRDLKYLSIDFELPKLEVLQAEDLKLHDGQLAAFIIRCSHLKHLYLQKCKSLSTKEVEDVVKNCNTLREINLRDCHNVSDDGQFLYWMVSVRPSLRRIVPPCGSVPPEIQDFFLQRGCLVCDDLTSEGQSMR